MMGGNFKQGIKKAAHAIRKKHVIKRLRERYSMDVDESGIKAIESLGMKSEVVREYPSTGRRIVRVWFRKTDIFAVMDGPWCITVLTPDESAKPNAGETDDVEN